MKNTLAKTATAVVKVLLAAVWVFALYQGWTHSLWAGALVVAGLVSYIALLRLHARQKPPRSQWWMLVPSVLVCAPLSAAAAVFMVYKLGFFIGGSAVAAIISSGFAFKLYEDRDQGAHASNMGQTLASATGSIAGIIAVLGQALTWIGAEDQFMTVNMVVYLIPVSMLGIGIGVMMTPALVDLMKLKYPSGLAVFEILNALKDWKRFKAAFKKLGGGIFGGAALSLPIVPRAWKPILPEFWHFDIGVFGAGMIVGPRIAVAGLVMGIYGMVIQPSMVQWGWLQPGQEFRVIGFYFGLAMILGASLVKIVVDFTRLRRERAQARAEGTIEESANKLGAWAWVWTIFWAISTVVVGHFTFGLSATVLGVAIFGSALFVLINGISVGVSDANPTTGAFVIGIILLVAIAGVETKAAALMGGIVLLVTIAGGVDMQTDRSTGWRLGSDRNMQFKFQVIGTLLGLAAGMALCWFFMDTYPELAIDITDEDAPEVAGWASAFTMKVVGALTMVDGYKSEYFIMLGSGFVVGFVMQLVRTKFAGRFEKSFLLDAVLFPNPFAMAFGAFVPYFYTCIFAAGGLANGAMNYVPTQYRQSRTHDDSHVTEAEGSADNAPYLIGGGLVAGAAIGAVITGALVYFGVL